MAAVEKRRDIKGANMATTAETTSSASPVKGRCYPCRNLLRERRLCPGCGLEMSYHALAYKHKCKQLPADPASKRRRRPDQLDARIQRRLGQDVVEEEA
eukprot:5623055-Karenia_brevis.AAC.1